MNGNDPATTGFAADARAVGVALAAVRAFADDLGLSPDTTARLAIVVEELVANLVEHGGAEGAPITLRLVMRPGEVALTLTDRGQHFDPRSAPVRQAVPERGGGAGIPLILAWSRVTGYARSGGANRLDLAIPLSQGN